MHTCIWINFRTKYLLSTNHTTLQRTINSVWSPPWHSASRGHTRRVGAKWYYNCPVTVNNKPQTVISGHMLHRNLIDPWCLFPWQCIIILSTLLVFYSITNNLQTLQTLEQNRGMVFNIACGPHTVHCTYMIQFNDKVVPIAQEPFWLILSQIIRYISTYIHNVRIGFI